MNPTLLTALFLHARSGATVRHHFQQLVEVETLLGLPSRLVLVVDRPTPDVEEMVDEWRRHEAVLAVFHPVLPLRSPENGEQLQAARDQVLSTIDALRLRPEWVSFCDDDIEWEPRWVNRLGGCLNTKSIQSWYAQSLFLWDAAGASVNIRQHHCSPHFFRFQPGDRMTPGVILHHPDRVQRWTQSEPERAAVLPFYLLDRGTATESERKALFRECARCGKLDDYTRAYVQPPSLMSLSAVMQSRPNPEDYGNWGQQDGV